MCSQTFIEAESYPGPSIIIAYSHCIAHGIDLDRGAGYKQQKLAVESGVWPLYRWDPRRIDTGESPLKLDSAPGKVEIGQYERNETRFSMVERMDPKRFAMLLERQKREVANRFLAYEHLAKLAMPVRAAEAEAAPSPAAELAETTSE